MQTKKEKLKGAKKMSRGKDFNHKEKGHPGNFPKNSFSKEKEHTRQTEQMEDIATHEAFKNRVKEDEMP
ncbi:hypothetical protein KHA93_21595 [Bacillus sp. FJAT-49732]|uniref:Uncharacterized protein n=1 Tax=Lederbergia citrisecunda TaxID=2833583 RepID=A0A942TRW4_9BACI|nr:hypothetical protein [Lederbergia citrisecunda]MBS4202208.1 hypothetical protein [Lederbergia citrisecunda]